jgi:hypothetical protein
MRRDLPDRPTKFPDGDKFFPDMIRKFPVRRLRELPHEPRGIPGLSASPIELSRLKIAKFPVIFPVSREFGPETGSLETGPSAT